jgi:signal transduction histidine kinase
MSEPAKRILIVEDQRLIAADLQCTLERLGYVVIGSVPSGEEAIARAGETSPDLVLMDILLRGKMDGIQAAKLIRDHYDKPVVFLTAYADIETIIRAKITTPFGYLVKPFNERELHAAVEVALHTHQMDRQLAEERVRRESAEEAVRARDEFLQIASHELRTPLTPLTLQLEAVQRTLERAGVADERLMAKLEIAKRQTARLRRLVESLLDVSQITSGHLTLRFEELDFADLVREVVGAFQKEARAAGCQIAVELERDCVGRWDRMRVGQLLANLLSNAIKYGSGQPIEIGVCAREGAISCEVADHGIGIEADALARIFDRFERGESVRHFGGLGLGLFIARHIAEAHGGTIVAQSQRGQGAKFTVVLPRQPPLGLEESRLQ